MPKTISKRALEGRRWRIQAREKRKLNTVVAKYVEEKHKDIYTICATFYRNVVDKYPSVQNLTKTSEFRFLLNTMDADEQTETCQGETVAVINQTETRQGETVAVINQTETRQGETVAVINQTETCQGEMVAVTKTRQGETVAAVTSQTGNESISVTPGNIYVEDGVIMNEYVVNNNNNDSNVDIISEAMSGVVGDNDEGIDRLADMDAIVNNILRDLEAVEPSIFQDINDEGIGLNTEDEFGNMVDEYDLW